MDLREYHAERIAEEAQRILNDRQMSKLSYTPTYRELDEFPEYIWAILDGEAVAYFPERTCHNVAPAYLDFLCSECGCVHYHSDENDTGMGNDWRFCPNCGAKVER